MTEYENSRILEVKNLKMHFPAETNFFGKTTKVLKAIDGVSFSLYEGKRLGL